METINFEVLGNLEKYIKKNGYDDLTVKKVIERIQSPNVKGLLDAEFESGITEAQYKHAMNVHRTKITSAFNNYVKKHNLDCYVFPTQKLPSQNLDVWRDDYMINHLGEEWNYLTLIIDNVDPASILGFPGITMPWGRARKSAVPFGMEIDTTTGNDVRLLSIARSIEKHALN
jgi:Asp-tRNA(Asn)/Glu-tRNA(Gln) amidotransferase A subunit family amidase